MLRSLKMEVDKQDITSVINNSNPREIIISFALRNYDIVSGTSNLSFIVKYQA